MTNSHPDKNEARRDKINAIVVVLTLSASILSAGIGVAAEMPPSGDVEQAVGGLFHGPLIFACTSTAIVLLLGNRFKAAICSPTLFAVAVFALPALFGLISLPSVLLSLSR